MSDYGYHESYFSDLDGWDDDFYVDPYEYEDDYDPMDPDSYEPWEGNEDAAMESSLFGDC